MSNIFLAISLLLELSVAGPLAGTAQTARGLCDTTDPTSTGDPTLDEQLQVLAFQLAQDFELATPYPPAICLVEDSRSAPLMRAKPEASLPGTLGTVLVGKSYLQSELTRHEKGGAAVAGLIAHEMAHIFQFRTSYLEELQASEPSKRKRHLELHADFLAGWFLATASYVDLDGIDAFANSLFEKGDLRFRSTDHHGTYAERYTAMLRGYFLGRDATVSFPDAARHGADFIKTIN